MLDRFRTLWRGRLRLVAFALFRYRPMAGAEDPPDDPEKKFTQADVDRIVQDRLARQKAQFDPIKAENDQLKTEIEPLKAAKTELDQLKASGQSDLERAQAAAQAAEQAKAEAEQRATEATDKASQTLMRAKIVTAAAKAGAHNPDAVYALMKEAGFKASGEGGNELQVTIGDDGQVTGHEDTVTAFLAAESNQYLVGEPPQPGPVGGGPRPTPAGAVTKEALAQMTPQQVAAIKPEDLDKALEAA
jgi:hypothetical protein